MKIIVAIVLGVIYAFFALPGFAFSGWILFDAPTWVGKAVGIAGFSAIVSPLSGYLWYRQKSHVWQRVTLGAVIVLLVIPATILLMTPSGHAPVSSPVQHRFTKDTGFPRYHISNIIPEAEQIHLGFLLSSYTDSLFTPEQSRRVSPFTFDLYREMERDRNFRALGSAMGWAYAEVLGLPFDVGHYYLYVPQNRGDEPLPAIVFLHGSVGNFKTYTWVWSKFAEKHGFVIIAPSFGFGNWMQPGGEEAALHALQDARQVVEIDAKRIYLAGISNGGLGVSQVAYRRPELFRGLIYLSPVMTTSLVDSAEFQHMWRDRPVLVVTGEADRRIPLAYVEQRVANLRVGKVAVSARFYPEEDHFLFFSQPDNVLDDISRWLSYSEE